MAGVKLRELLGTLKETISSQASYKDEGSTTIENITKKKYLSEEVSRVHYIYIVEMGSILYMVIVYSMKI